MKKRRTEKAWISARIAPPPGFEDSLAEFGPLSCGTNIGVVVLWRLGSSKARLTLCCGDQFDDVAKLVGEAESSKMVQVLGFMALGQVTKEKHLKKIRAFELAGVDFPNGEESLKEVMDRVEKSLLSGRNDPIPPPDAA